MVHFKEFKNKQATMPEPGQQYNTFQLKSKKKKRDRDAAPANWTTATCLAPKLEPCRRCTPAPVTTTAKGGEGRWCVHTKEQLTRCGN